MSRQHHLLVVEVLATTMDFKQRATQTGIWTYGCFATRKGTEAPHSFAFKLGRGPAHAL
jgi:hypothetical protein